MSYMNGSVEHFLCSGYHWGGYRSGYNIAGTEGCYTWNGISTKYSCLCKDPSFEWIKAGKAPQCRSVIQKRGNEELIYSSANKNIEFWPTTLSHFFKNYYLTIILL